MVRVSGESEGCCESAHLEEEVDDGRVRGGTMGAGRGGTMGCGQGQEHARGEAGEALAGRSIACGGNQRTSRKKWITAKTTSWGTSWAQLRMPWPHSAVPAGAGARGGLVRHRRARWAREGVRVRRVRRVRRVQRGVGRAGCKAGGGAGAAGGGEGVARCRRRRR